VRIVVDRGLCQGHGVCESEAPDLFTVSKKGDLTVLDERPARSQRRALELAVKYCPTHALSIVDETVDDDTADGETADGETADGETADGDDAADDEDTKGD
jgi:ferredoxin